MLVETRSSVEEMEAFVNSLSQLSNMKVNFFAFSGESSSTLLTFADPRNLEELTYELAESTQIRTGKAIPYEVRSALSNEIVNVALNTRYDVTTCEALNPNGPKLSYMSQ